MPSDNFHNEFLACNGQTQDVFNAFQVLTNDGFLHDQGVLTLEAVQKFYEEILKKPKEATLKEERFIDLCRSMKQRVHPVVTLKLKKSKENEEYYHAVTLHNSVVERSMLKITLSDSRPKMGEKTIRVPISELPNFESGKNSVVMGWEEWCLGDEMCYYLVFN